MKVSSSSTSRYPSLDLTSPLQIFFFVFLSFFFQLGPTVEQLKGTSVDLTITGRGYSKKAFESGTAKEPDVKAVIKIRAPEPGYVATPILFVAVARVILQEESKIHRGVSVPAAALRDTSLIKNLNEDGRVTFRSVS